ncbi:MAG: methyltransferase [Actinobacteria bacterium]|nr:methyltransferase [Actinomycetota bacterium]
MVTQAIAAMARGGVADAVAERPRTVPELAATTGLDEDAFRRVLRALAALGIFRVDDDGLVSNTPSSEYLRSDVGGSVRWIAQSFAGDHYRVWEYAAEAFEQGGAVAERALGESYFDWLAHHPAEAEIFNRAMAAGSAVRFEALVERAWSDELVVDIGGGTGGLLAALLGRHTGLRGIVVDLPHSAAAAEARLAEAGIADRCTFVSGDFFAEVPAGGDVYVLSQILHDWDDEAATRILRTCRAAAEPSSGLLILDAVLPEGDGAHLAKLLDLHMLVLHGGRERTEAEWRVLLRAGGFELERAEVTGAFPVIEARPLASDAETD